MLEIDQITIITGIIILALTLGTSLLNPYLFKVRIPKSPKRGKGYTRRKEMDIQSEDADKQTDVQVDLLNRKGKDQPVSIIITAHDEKAELERNLPLFLYQDYDADFQVIVVAESHESDTEYVLKKLKKQFGDRFYYTLIPDTSRYMSRKKLQITLGVKAAKYDWILLTTPTCHPDSSSWLKYASKYRTDQSNLVLGVTNYDSKASSYQRFEHIFTALSIISQAKHGIPYRTNMPYICFRKNEFLKKEGFRNNLELIRGEFDFLVNKYAKEEGTEVTLDPRSWLTEEAPTDKTWCDLHLCYCATKKKLKHTIRPRLISAFYLLFFHASILADIFSMVWGGITSKWIIFGIGFIALMISLSVRWMAGRLAIRPYDKTIPTILLPFYELSLSWHTLYYKLRYLNTDKYDFTCHKL